MLPGAAPYCLLLRGFMAKIGRNTPCPCGSGKKYKKCCAGKHESAVLAQQQAAAAARLTLMSAVEALQQDAAAGKVVHRELGVFFFFTSAEGDAWVLEMTDQDAVQVAAKGEALAPPIDENPETIEINWSYMFELKEKELTLTAYSDKSAFVLAGAPTRELNAAMKRMKKRFSREQLDQVHIENRDAG